MRKFMLKAFSLISAGIIISSGLFVTPIFASKEQVSVCDIMVYANEEHFENINEARAALEIMAGDNIEVCGSYPVALFGFWARVPEHYVNIIDESEYFDAHISGSFTPLSSSEAEYSTSSLYASKMLGVTPMHESGYLGQGTVVAVIDNGFDVTHEVFAHTPLNPSLTKENITELISEKKLKAASIALNLDGIYVNEKIPFAFDYSGGTADVSTLESHGTHVAATIGGKSEVMTGVAPECQLLLMKVFSQSLASAAEQFVAAALEDAVTLGADVINMSLGTYSGSVGSSQYSSIDRMAKKLTNAGITVVCSVGNDGSSGYTSSFSNYFDLPYPLADMPDYGTVNHPAVVEDYIAVASAGNTHIAYDTLIHKNENGDIRRMEYTDTNASLGIIKTTFAEHFDKSELEYVFVPGLGNPEDYTNAGIDVKGKIALIERGTITFIEKVNNASAAGAVAVIVYDNTDGEEVYMELTGCTIPAAFISKEDGEYLKAVSNKVLTFDGSLSEFIENPNAYRMSDFSSWGTTPSMTLKPDVTAIGESVYSAATGNTYTSLSGTSMATPFVSGFAALFNEKLDQEESKYILSKRPKYIKNAIMNTAKPLIDPNTNAEYSPRNQGAGLANLNDALNAEFLITSLDGGTALTLVRDAESNNKYSLEFIVENLTDEDITLELDTSVICDSFATVTVEKDGEEKEFVLNTLSSRKLENTVIEPEEDSGLAKTDKKNVYTLSLGALDDCSVLLCITLDPEDIKDNIVFENGYFVEGFIYARTDSSESSAPFIGFSSDFTQADIFDITVYENGNIPFFTGNALMSKNEDDSFTVLGSADGTVNGAHSEFAAFSPGNDEVFSELYLSPSLLRNISNYKIEITDSNGTVISTVIEGTPMTKGGAERHDPIFLWDGGDGIYPDYNFPDGEYTVKITASSDDGKTKQSLSIPVLIDTRAPGYVSSSVKTEDGRRSLTLEASDNNKVKSVKLYNSASIDSNTDGIVLYDIDDGDELFTFDITDIAEHYLWADITDYAMNTKTAKIRIPAE